MFLQIFTQEICWKKKTVESENPKVESFDSSLFRCSSSYLGAAREGASGGKDGGARPSGLHPEPQQEGCRHAAATPAQQIQDIHVQRHEAKRRLSQRS